MSPLQEKPVIHGRDHSHGGPDPTQIAYEDVGGTGGGGGGIQFDVTPQSGTFLDIRTTGVQSPTNNGITLQATDAINIYGEEGVAINGVGAGGVILNAAASGGSPSLTLSMTSSMLLLQEGSTFLLLIEKVAGTWNYRIPTGKAWVANL